MIKMSTTTLHFHHFFQSYLFDSKTEQIAYFLSPSHGIAQKTILACLTAETTCKLRRGAKQCEQLPYFWLIEQLSTAHQSGVAVLILASLTVSCMTP